MAAHCSFFRLSMAFPTVRAPYCSAVGSALLIPPLVNGISAGSRAVLLSGWQRIAHTYARERLSRRFAYRVSQRMVADCPFILSSTAFMTVCAPFCSADGSGLLVLSFVNGLHDGLRAVLRRGWQRIALTSAHQPLSRQFGRRMAQLMAADCSYLHSSMAFTMVFAPYCSVDGSGLLILPLVNGFPARSRAVLHREW